MARLLHGQGTMERPPDTNPPSAVNPTPNRKTEPYLGGADAVQKTSTLGDVPGSEVNDPAHAPVESTATVQHNGGLGAIGWILLVLAILVAVAYATGLVT
jgi:hypothetical protein